MKFVNVGNALKVTCVGFAAGVLLRVVQMLYFFDYDTGFYTDGGVMAWVSLGAPVLCGLLAAWMCFRSRRYFGPYVPRRNPLTGAAALLSGAALVFAGGAQALELRAGELGTYRAVHLLFAGASLLFGLVQLAAAAGFFVGRNYLRRVPLLYLAAVLWGVAYVVMVYVFYARSSSLVENLFSVFGGVFTLLALFYLCKLLAGVDEEGAAKRLFATGVLGVVLQITYALSNLALLPLGRTYSGEIPPFAQLSSLGVALFLLVFLVSFRKSSLRRTPREGGERGGRRFRSK